MLDSSSAAVRPQTAVLPWRRAERDTRETSRECELVMADRVAAPLYSGDDRVARLSLSRQLWGVGMRCAIDAHSYRLGVVVEHTFLSPGFFE